jgi:hypothetical protein
MTAPWHPYREPLRTTLLRTGTIALVIGAVLAARWGGFARWPIAIVLALWPSLGGHFVEVGFLNWLRPRLPDGRGDQVAARLTTWFVAGIVLATGMYLTALALAAAPPARGLAWWWTAGLAFIGIELVAHLALQLRGCPSFYNGRG